MPSANIKGTLITMSFRGTVTTIPQWAFEDPSGESESSNAIATDWNQAHETYVGHRCIADPTH